LKYPLPPSIVKWIQEDGEIPEEILNDFDENEGVPKT
jgi:uncharacterized protein (DUF433 family)